MSFPSQWDGNVGLYVGSCAWHIPGSKNQWRLGASLGDPTQELRGSEASESVVESRAPSATAGDVSVGVGAAAVARGAAV